MAQWKSLLPFQVNIGYYLCFTMSHHLYFSVPGSHCWKASCEHPHSHHADLGISEEKSPRRVPRRQQKSFGLAAHTSLLLPGERTGCVHQHWCWWLPCSSPSAGLRRSINAWVSSRLSFQVHPFLLSFFFFLQKLPILGLFPGPCLVLVMLPSRLCLWWHLREYTCVFLTPSLL